MTTLLFPTSDHPAGARRKPDYAPFMSDIARAASDAADALSLFANLVEGTAGGPDSVGFMAFDAHGGDTGCQLRAGMMQEVFFLYRHMFEHIPDAWKTIRSWIDESTAKLRLVHGNAKHACMKLVRDKVHPNKLGLATTEDIPENMLRILGAHLSRYLPTTGTIKIDGRRSPSVASMESGNPSSASTTNAELDAVSLATTWDPLSIHTLARFIIFCYVLSKYKVFATLNGNVGARLAPDDAAEASYKFIRPYTDKKKRPGKPQRTLRELAELQTWLTGLSCAWQRSLAHRSIQATDMERLLISTLQQSNKGLAAMACYPGYLLARESWASVNCTLLLIDRHFCDEGGFHYNIFAATMGSPLMACPCHEHPLGLDVTWTLNQISLEELIQDDELIRPHLVIMGNSINGGHDEYMQRFAAKVRPHNCSADEVCIDNEAHITHVLSANHDRLALSFFASHKAYAFSVSYEDYKDSDSDNAEVAFVEHRMDIWAETIGAYDGGEVAATAASLKESWRISREEADAMGTGGGNMRVFAWQHAFLETKGRVVRRIQKWIEIGELMPLHAPIH
ncbi:hypothetical protein K458DRAFT_445516 [Lentithecium fluviatile CBS 122367]|uniref:Uncharacterized protein n=1 Tax=Lentithecium fluviatile CBS 122367 TaxID=1168545 RepID=A0A6G1IPK1_9PLEO|nr:hypothetical protein K458DRAFT_445516 [Lentithecium fluviatile CBS 122367]